MIAKDVVEDQDWSAGNIGQLDMGMSENCAAECTTQRQNGGEKLALKSTTAMSTRISFITVFFRLENV